MSSHHSKSQHRNRSQQGLPGSKRPFFNGAKLALNWLFPAGLPKRRWARRLLVSFVSIITLSTSAMYGIALWYTHSQPQKPTTIGVSFIPDYASYLGLDPHETLQSLLHIGVRHLRLVSYWSDIEPTQGKYDFGELDSEMTQAQAAGAKVTLAIGLRQPRWPECHAPGWIDTTQPASSWTPQLNTFMTAVINRYKDSPALESYQLENEFYNHFGTCTDFSRDRLDSELRLTHQLDSHHPVIISRSDNYKGFSIKKPLPDIVGISVYRRVWDGTLTHRYLQYPFPSWYYAFLAGTQQILTGKPSVLHELQTEAWPPHGLDIKATSLDEQNKSFDARRMQATIDFGKQTGLKTIDLWGAEYWYYRMQILHDPSLWQTAERTFGNSN